MGILEAQKRSRKMPEQTAVRDLYLWIQEGQRRLADPYKGNHTQHIPVKLLKSKDEGQLWRRPVQNDKAQAEEQ